MNTKIRMKLNRVRIQNYELLKIQNYIKIKRMETRDRKLVRKERLIKNNWVTKNREIKNR